MRREDLVKQSFGNLRVVGQAPSIKGRTYQHCMCECGRAVNLPTHLLKQGGIVACGLCQKWDRVTEGEWHEFSMQRFGWLISLGYVGKLFVKYELKNESLRPFWLCRCKCGSYVRATGVELRRGRVASCIVCSRAYRTELFHIRVQEEEHEHIHGLPEWQQQVLTEHSYRAMLWRVKNDSNYADVRIHPPWIEKNGKGLRNFIADVGLRRLRRLSLERRDNQGDYAPNNVEWADRPKQARNKRTSRKVSFQGQEMNLTDFATSIGKSKSSVSRRLKRLIETGLPEAEALWMMTAESNGLCEQS